MANRSFNHEDRKRVLHAIGRHLALGEPIIRGEYTYRLHLVPHVIYVESRPYELAVFVEGGVAGIVTGSHSQKVWEMIVEERKKRDEEKRESDLNTMRLLLDKMTGDDNNG